MNSMRQHHLEGTSAFRSRLGILLMALLVTTGVLAGGGVAPAAARAETVVDPAAAPAADIVVDNTDPGFSGQGWIVSTGQPNFYGSNYAFANPNLGNTARWTPNVAVAGTYGVYYWIPTGAQSRATNAKFRVHGAGGEDRVYTVDQRSAKGGTWVLLGNRDFAVGSGGYVELSDAANGIVIADAIKLGPVGQASLSSQVSSALAAGVTDIRIDPGDYRQASWLNLGDLVGSVDGVTIDATGVNLIMTAAEPAIGTGTTTNLTLIGMSVTYDPLPYTQGRVVDIAPDGTWMDVQISAGYPKRLGDRARMYDSVSKLFKDWTLSSNPTWEDQSKGIIRSNVLGGAALNDIVVYQWSDTHSAAISINGAHTTLKNVTLYAAHMIGITNPDGYGDTVLDGVRVIPAPLPAGATDPPIQSTNLDATQFQGVIHGPTVINSTIVNPGDDITSIVGLGNFAITAVSDDTIDVQTAGPYNRGPSGVQVGDRIARWLDGPFATVTAITADSDETWTLTLDQTVPADWVVGTTVCDLDRRGSGFRYANNHFDGPGRVLIKTSDGVIEDNWLRTTVKLSPETAAAANGYTGGNVDISGNTFVNQLWGTPSGYSQSQSGAVCIDGWNQFGVYSYPSINVTGNVFDGIKAVNVMVKGGTNVTVADNQFKNPLQGPTGNVGQGLGYPSSTVVFVTNSDGVAFSGNTITNMGLYSVAPAIVRPDAKNVTGLPEGLQVNPQFVVPQDVPYRLQNLNSRLFLGSVGDSSKAGTSVEQRAEGTSFGQDWKFVSSDPGTVLIQNVISGLYLTAAGTTSSTVNQQALSGGTATALQKWQLIDVGGGRAQIQNVASGYRLGMSAGSTTPGSLVGQYAASGSLNQAFAVIPDIAPVMTADSPPLTGSTVDVWSYPFAASGTIPVYSVVGTLPPGLTIDPATGTVSGTPTTVGSYSFSVRAVNAAGSVTGAQHEVVISLGTDRVAGSDRFDTSVSVSQAAFPTGAPVAFVASGTGFADALSAGPAAAKLGGPVLLTAPDALPGEVAAEITRLKATKIVVVGGPNAVSDTVFNQLAKLVPDTVRKSGSDRFETSRQVAAYAFGTDAKAVAIATGLNFPDALSAGAALGSTGPVILVDGGAATLDAATRSTVQDLGPEAIWVVGGPSAVGAGIETGLNAIASTDRLAGSDRFGTSEAINSRFFATADRALLATGMNFPDALSGSAWAPTMKAPLFVVQSGCVPQGVLDQLTALGVKRATLLGGPSALTEAVAKLTPCGP